ncbi:MAG: hypothetical protein AB3N20_09660 [Rhizobiaceae bacterium]
MTDLTHSRYIDTESGTSSLMSKFVARLRLALGAMAPASDSAPRSEKRCRDIGLGEEYTMRHSRDHADAIEIFRGIPL